MCVTPGKLLLLRKSDYYFATKANGKVKIMLCCSNFCNRFGRKVAGWSGSVALYPTSQRILSIPCFSDVESRMKHSYLVSSVQCCTPTTRTFSFVCSLLFGRLHFTSTDLKKKKKKKCNKVVSLVRVKEHQVRMGQKSPLINGL